MPHKYYNQPPSSKPSPSPCSAPHTPQILPFIFPSTESTKEKFSPGLQQEPGALGCSMAQLHCPDASKTSACSQVPGAAAPAASSELTCWANPQAGCSKAAGPEHRVLPLGTAQPCRSFSAPISSFVLLCCKVPSSCSCCLLALLVTPSRLRIVLKKTTTKLYPSPLQTPRESKPWGGNVARPGGLLPAGCCTGASATAEPSPKPGGKGRFGGGGMSNYNGVKQEPRCSSCSPAVEASGQGGALLCHIDPQIYMLGASAAARGAQRQKGAF